MQTHFSEQVSLDRISTQAVADMSLQQELEPTGPCTCLIDQVNSMLQAEQVVTQQLLSLQKEVPQDFSDGKKAAPPGQI